MLKKIHILYICQYYIFYLHIFVKPLCNASKYKRQRMDHVKFVEDNLKRYRSDMVCLNMSHTSNFEKFSSANFTGSTPEYLSHQSRTWHNTLVMSIGRKKQKITSKICRRQLLKNLKWNIFKSSLRHILIDPLLNILPHIKKAV